jgi:hypothetical protein
MAMLTPYDRHAGWIFWLFKIAKIAMLAGKSAYAS